MWLFSAGRLIRFHGSTRNVKKGMKCFSSSGLSSFDSQTAYPKDYRNEVNARWNQTITTGLLWSIVHKLGFSVHRLYCFYENEICYDEPRRYSALKSLCVPNEGLNGRLMMRQLTQVCFPEGKFSSKTTFEVFRSSPYTSPPWRFSLQKVNRPVVTYKFQFWIGICFNNERRRKRVDGCLTDSNIVCHYPVKIISKHASEKVRPVCNLLYILSNKNKKSLQDIVVSHFGCQNHHPEQLMKFEAKILKNKVSLYIARWG